MSRVVSTEEAVANFSRRIESTMRQLMKLRKCTPDDAEFGRLAAPFVDKLIAGSSGVPPLRHGAWSDEEREILRAVYKEFPSHKAPAEAAKVLNRTRSQINAMAGNMGLR